MKTKQKILIALIILAMTAGCSAIKSTDRVSDAPSKDEKFVPSQSAKTALLEDSIFVDAKPNSYAKTFPGLNLQQIKKLKALIGNNNRDKIDFKVILPTYLPNGYRVHQLRAVNNAQYSISYEVIYRNSDNECFTLRADNGQWGDGLSGLSRINVSSSALGVITLEHTDFDRLSSSSFVSFRKDILRANSTRTMMSYSMVSIRDNHYLPEFSGCKAELRLNEAVKIVESLRYLKP
jgi:hypothetical protein